MEPIAAGFVILVGTAAFIGVVVGAIGGAAVWRLKWNLVLGAVLTACAYLLALIAEHPEDFHWLRPKLTWGAPSMAMAFLISSVSAPWVAARTQLRPTSTALAAFGFSLGIGLLFLFLFRLGLQAPLVTALAADVCLVLLLLIRRRRPVMQ